MRDKQTRNYIIAVAFILWSVLSIEGKLIRHEFQPNTNFENKKRWSNADHEFPCAGDTVVFEPDKVISIYVQINQTISEMFLPMDGEFIFADRVIWGINEQLSSCHSDDVQETHVVSYVSDADDWFKKDNWKAFSATDDNEISTKDLLDVEKVPCDHDRVVFLPTASFTVSADVNVKLSSLVIWGKDYDKASFASYRMGRGRYQFDGNGAIDSNMPTCSDPTGCACRTSTNSGNIHERICSKVTCESEKCESPIEPVGQCCRACGALLNIVFGSAYTEEAMKKYLENFVSNGKYPGIHIVLSKISPAMSAYKNQRTADMAMKRYVKVNDYVQVLITDENAGGDSGSTAKKLAEDLSSGLTSGTPNLGIINVTVALSGAGIQSQNGLSSSAVVGVVFGVLFGIALLTATAFFFTRKRILFSRFAPHMKLYGSNQNIDNPMYDMSQPVTAFDQKMEGNLVDKDSSIAGLPSLSAITSDFGVTFGNPLYYEDDV
ncbi:unnamed protein product [Clavelina lepadiformis]|uniref:Protein amnionless n=1 Tax=Clavelina lepadiformis TaxID=159417 RepID=A0ABP0GW14_CLALP